MPQAHLTAAAASAYRDGAWRRTGAPARRSDGRAAHACTPGFAARCAARFAARFAIGHALSIADASQAGLQGVLAGLASRAKSLG